MKEGKIYKKNRAALALENFFSADNLSALRELSLRRTADRIEKQTNNGRLKTKVLVLVSPSPSSAKNIRVAARMAEAYHCRYSAMYVEKSGTLSDEAAANIKKHMNLVRDTGGNMIVKYGDDVVETVADYVKLAGVTNLIVGKTWQSVGKKVGLEDKFIAALPEIELLIVPDNGHFSSGVSPAKAFFGKLFHRNKLLQRYKAANRIFDIADLIAQAALEKDRPKGAILAEVLARAFGRSCILLKGRERHASSWAGESLGPFDEENERAVAEWCRKNGKPAGKGTDTLRGARAVYFPLVSGEETAVAGFSCSVSKMSVTDRLVFRQLENILKLALFGRLR